MNNEHFHIINLIANLLPNYKTSTYTAPLKPNVGQTCLKAV